MTLQELALNLQAIKHEAKVLWGKEAKYFLECTGCDCTFNYWEDTDEPTLKFCNQCGSELRMKLDYYYQTYMKNLHEMIDSEDPVKYLKESKKGGE